MKSCSARRLLLLAALALGLTHTTTRAASIGVNFHNGSRQLAAGDSAGVAPYAQTNYNNVISQNSGFLVDDTGTATTATVSLSINSFGTVGSAAATPDEKLNGGVAFEFVDWSFTLSNIPYAAYRLIVYDLNFTDGVQGVTAGGTTFYTRSPDPSAPGYVDNNAGTPYTYTLSTSTDSGNPTPLSNYVVFENLSGASQTVNLTAAGGLRSVGGFQIVQIPEPSSIGLLLTGGILAMARWRRKSRKA